MKNLIKCGIAAAMVLATAMPAMAAQSWVVCVDQSKDVRTSTETNLVGTAILPRFFVGAAPVYPASTVTTTATACTPVALGGATQVGTFFSWAAWSPACRNRRPPTRMMDSWLFGISG